MADQSSDASAGSTPQRRRMSIADMFGGRPNTGSFNASSPPSGVPANPDVAQHKRGVSISTLGLGGQNQASPYTAFARQRRASISTSSAASSPEFRNSFADESAVLEEDDNKINGGGSPPSPSFARRVSFGAQALRDVRQGGTSAPNGGEGFNWSESLRDRTKRSPSFSSGNPFGISRTKSVGQPPAPEPPKEMPKSPPTPLKMKKPDHLGERMLRGDFMMD